MKEAIEMLKKTNFSGEDMVGAELLKIGGERSINDMWDICYVWKLIKYCNKNKYQKNER